MKFYLKLFFAILLVWGVSFIPLIQPLFFPNSAQLLSRFPVLEGGRIKPLDSVARSFLLTTRGKQSVRTNEGASLSAEAWFLQAAFLPEKADLTPVFRVDDPGILALMGVETGQKRYFTYTDLVPHFVTFEPAATQADLVPSKQRNSFQQNILLLRQNIQKYAQLKNTLHLEIAPDFFTRVSSDIRSTRTLALTSQDPGHLRRLALDFRAFEWMTQNALFRSLPPQETTGAWFTMGEGLMHSLLGKNEHPMVSFWMRVGVAVQMDKLTSLNQDILQTWHSGFLRFPEAYRKSYLEWIYSHWQPFYTAMLLYGFVFIGVFLCWLFRRPIPTWLYGVGFGVFALHTSGIVIRMFLQGRPPVTNLYSSAVFVGWIAALMGLSFDHFKRNGVGLVTAAVTGFLSLIIAHHLAVQGDTMEMMQAVLDSNFWLSTHVVTVTMGYGAMFLAGFVAHIYIFQKLFSIQFSKEAEKSLTQMVFAILCFALVFSFVGTILGGIWADQSWGRFWGWDPKENGALMIVLWVAAILHARMGGMIRSHGLMITAVFGNIVTSFSWFGVNMLGVGLHSYGFMKSAFFWLVLFVFFQLLVIWVSFLPHLTFDFLTKKGRTRDE